MAAPVLEKLNFYSQELYKMKRENIYDWHPMKIGALLEKRELYPAPFAVNARKIETANILYTMHWLEVQKMPESNLR